MAEMLIPKVVDFDALAKDVVDRRERPAPNRMTHQANCFKIAIALSD